MLVLPGQLGAGRAFSDRHSPQTALGASETKTLSMTLRRSSKAGFTLVELMIVVAVIGLLAAIAIPSYVRARTQSQTTACISNLRRIDDACQEWALDNRKAANADVSFSDIQPYLRGAITCPSAGTRATFADSYTLTTVSNKPTCNVVPATHVLPADTAQVRRVTPVW
jgi:prepilin-type N-terminal cleavage/methylation domain-containing protein